MIGEHARLGHGGCRRSRPGQGRTAQRGADASESLLGAAEEPVFSQLVAQLAQNDRSLMRHDGGRRASEDTVRYPRERQAFGNSAFDFQDPAFERAECATVTTVKGQVSPGVVHLSRAPAGSV